MSPILDLLEKRMMKLVVTTGAIRRAKLQSNHHHQQTNTQCFTGWMSFLSTNQEYQSTEGKSKDRRVEKRQDTKRLLISNR